MILSVLYWVVLILSLLGFFVPEHWGNRGSAKYWAWIVLFVLIGLRIFRLQLN
jgi:hypothetical protein